MLCELKSPGSLKPLVTNRFQSESPTSEGSCQATKQFSILSSTILLSSGRQLWPHFVGVPLKNLFLQFINDFGMLRRHFVLLVGVFDIVARDAMHSRKLPRRQGGQRRTAQRGSDIASVEEQTLFRFASHRFLSQCSLLALLHCEKGCRPSFCDNRSRSMTHDGRHQGILGTD